VYAKALGVGNGIQGAATGGYNAVEGDLTNSGSSGAGVYGYSDGYGSGVSGQAVNGVGVAGASNNGIGAEGVAIDNYAGYFQNSSTNSPTLYVFNTQTGGTGLFRTLVAVTPEGICGIGGKGDLSCTGQVKSLVSVAGGARKVETYAPQSAENWMEDYGTGVMERGVALVKIDPAFAETITADSSYHIFLTPKGDSNGLYVINETPTSFEVRESKGGTSSLAFDYKIVAKRRGYEAERLVDVTDRYNTEQKAAQASRPVAPVHPPRVQPQLHPQLNGDKAAAGVRLVPPGRRNAVPAGQK
jgi:hypothetical protein